MTNPIVKVLASQQKAPTPSALQKTGALISMGATTLGLNGVALLTQASDLTPYLQSTLALASLSQAAGVATGTLPSTTIASGTYNATTGLVTLTLTASINLKPGMLFSVASATGTGSFASLDGTWVAGAATSGTTLTYTIPASLTMTITGGNVAGSLNVSSGSLPITVSGATPAVYNGTFYATVTSATTFTYSVPSGTTTPAAGTPAITVGNQSELLQMVTTFFAQGTGQGVYVLEFGAGSPTTGIAALSTYIANNPNTQPNQPGQLPAAFYGYLVPRNWDGVSAFITLVGLFTATSSKGPYFFVTTTSATYTDYASKSVFCLIEAPNVQASEFSCAAPFQVTLNYAPSATNRVTPLNLAFLSGVTAYPTTGNSSILSMWNAGNVNVVQTGAQGGLSNLILFGGNMMDGNPFNYWYAADWAQINGQQAVTAACINGSNNPLNPLDYNQDGINTLQTTLVTTMGQGISYGLILNPIQATQLSAANYLAALNNGTYNGYTGINADPFASYTTENPDDYGNGVYNGLAVSMTPLRGFASITFTIVVSSFA